MVNKFLYPNGGSETYIFKLGNYLQSQGHEVQCFGMDDERNVVGNNAKSYTSNMDFHSGRLQKVLYPFKIIYSVDARRKIRNVLDDFQPDVVHLNNFNFQITPSIIYEIKKYREKIKRKVEIVFTAHDYQLVCPNHMMNNPNTRENCEKCLGGKFVNCTKGRCIHGSTLRSALGSIEGYFYKALKTYKLIDTVICPSSFMESKIKANPMLIGKTVTLHNFIDEVEDKDVKKQDYILYFGRFSEEKGIKTLINVCRNLSKIQFVFAGSGPLENEIINIKNIKNIGFQKGEALEKLIREARFSLYPSEWYENCPFSVIESQLYRTPVLGADIGGIPELIEVGKTGELFRSGDSKELQEKIEALWRNKEKCETYSKNCKNIKFNTINDYCKKLIEIYKG